jgi:hypothetical protein
MTSSSDSIARLASRDGQHTESNETVSTLRFDVACHISVLAQNMTRPTEKLVKAAYRVMGYLVGTPHFNICYKIPAYPELRNRIYAACDASFADDRLTRKSQQGHSLRAADMLYEMVKCFAI